MTNCPTAMYSNRYSLLLLPLLVTTVAPVAQPAMQSVLGKSVGSAPLSVSYGAHQVADGAELSKAQVGLPGGGCQAVPCSCKAAGIMATAGATCWATQQCINRKSCCVC